MNPLKRRKSRELAIQVIYSWQISKKIILSEIKNYVIQQNKGFSLDSIYFDDIVNGVIQNVNYLDNIINPILSKKIQKIDQIEKAILRLSSYEITKRLDVPYKVVINEGIELAKKFGSKTSHKFINGVLDKLISKKN
ncbi:Transcription antitermination protein NusB [Buchnera aphidicola (Cinara piceae)]|uniref:Transcription antitermination protein NusB n=1 Tax=Buchnera aphidicola (Cinara piceae) TaxID=1660043 RepID=A0A803GCT9_9GAMM|nr:transcription antitermination factor NusB [Buchnera aphidicola]VFP88592.1 Transcription antitermination protein NusB [Buchnera aphidicola (Cinara piceae)]